VRGARAGQVLEIAIDSVVPSPWGTTYAGLLPTAWNARLGVTEPSVHPWIIDVAAGTARNRLGHSVPLRPFLGIIGMPPAEPGRHSTIPPRWHEATPVASTPAGWVCLGIGDDLDQAAAEAMDAMLGLLSHLHGLSRSDAMALASVVVDLRVTQVANQVFGVHAVLPDDPVR
jgi:acetamidase/formamidase